MSIKIDARGLACPKPVINTKRELDNLEEGVVVTIVDNETAKENILKLLHPYSQVFLDFLWFLHFQHLILLLH